MEWEKYFRFPRTKRQKCGRRTCSVSNCNSRDNGDVRFHEFPRRGQKVVLKGPDLTMVFCERRKVWEDIVGVEEKITKKSRVCSIHFKIEDYQGTSQRILKTTAIPTLNLPEESSAFFTFKQRRFDIIDFNQMLNATKDRSKLALQECEIPTIDLSDDSNVSTTKLESEIEKPPKSLPFCNAELFDMLLMHTSFEFETLTASIL